MTVNHDVAGSNPASGASGLFVKRLRHRPFTAGSGVRIPHRSPWAISSAGRASALQAECQQFDPVIAHQKKASRDPLRGVFFLPFSFFLYSHLTSCIRDSRSFARRFAPSNDVRCGTSSILLSPTIMKSSTCSAPWDFLLPFPSHLIYHLTSCIRDSLYFVRRFAPSKCVRCGTSSILLSPTKKKTSCDLLHGVFFLAFFLTPYLSFNLLHPRSRSFARRFAPSKCVRCGTSSILFSPTIMKSSTCSAPWDFLLPFPFSLICHSPCP